LNFSANGIQRSNVTAEGECSYTNFGVQMLDDSFAGGFRIAATSGYCLATLRVDVLRASQSPAKSCGMFKS